MKLSFSTFGWDGIPWDNFVKTAKALQFQGIEISSVDSELFTKKGSDF